jgi:hypothetical protein
MTRRQQHRARRAAFLALAPGRFVMANRDSQAAKPAVDSAIEAMRKEAEEFSALARPATPSPLKSTGSPAVNGSGHAGAITC